MANENSLIRRSLDRATRRNSKGQAKGSHKVDSLTTAFESLENTLNDVLVPSELSRRAIMLLERAFNTALRGVPKEKANK